MAWRVNISKSIVRILQLCSFAAVLVGLYKMPDAIREYHDWQDLRQLMNYLREQERDGFDHPTCALGRLDPEREQQIRENLKAIKSDEIVFILPDPKNPSTPE
jgi:hypothetical protein